MTYIFDEFKCFSDHTGYFVEHVPDRLTVCPIWKVQTGTFEIRCAELVAFGECLRIDAM